MDLSKGTGLQISLEPCPPNLPISGYGPKPSRQRGMTAGAGKNTAGGRLLFETGAAIIPMDLGPPGKRARRFTDRSKGEGSFVVATSSSK